jgi:lipoprotein-releasing system permease protein
MGAGPNNIRKIFLSEGMLLGLLGTAAGILLAVVICLLQLKFKWIKLGGGAFLIDYFPVKLMVQDFILVAATAWLITWIASWLPAAKAAKEPILFK